MVPRKPRKKGSAAKSEQVLETSVAEASISSPPARITKLKKEMRQGGDAKRRLQLNRAFRHEAEVETEEANKKAQLSTVPHVQLEDCTKVYKSRRLQRNPAFRHEAEVETEEANKEAQLYTVPHVQLEDCTTETFPTASANPNGDKEAEQPEDLEHTEQSTQIPCTWHTIPCGCDCGMLCQRVDRKLEVHDEKHETANCLFEQLVQCMSDLETRHAEESHRSQVVREIKAIRRRLEKISNKWQSLYQENPDLVTKMEKGEEASEIKKNPGIGFGSDEIPGPVDLHLGSRLAPRNAVNPLEPQQSIVPPRVEEQSRESEFCSQEMELGVSSAVDDNPGRGFYTDESLNPMDLQKGVQLVKNLVKRFANHFSNSLMGRQDTKFLLTQWYSSIHFSREHHVVSYGLKAAINKVLFKDFEREDFAKGITPYLDQGTRSRICTDYFQHHNTKLLDDKLFSNFKQKKFCSLMKKFNLPKELRRMNADEALVKWEDSSLVSDFHTMVTSIWLLHKVAFAFVPPASIFRIPETAELNEEYMNPVEEDQHFEPRVGFMVMPGFRLGKTVIKAEIYPSITRVG